MKLVRGSTLQFGLLLWSLLAFGTQAAVAQPRTSDACDAVFATPASGYLHVQKSELSAKELLQEGRHQEALWVAQETGQKALAEELYKMVEKTLLKGAVRKAVKIGEGVSGGSYLTFDNGIKGVFKPGHVSYVKHEVGAYKLDRAMKLNLIPMTVYRETPDFTGTVQLFIPNAPQRTYWANADAEYFKGVDPKRINMLGLFDRMIGNNDRHGMNYLVTKDTRRIVAIDQGHTMWNEYADRQAGVTAFSNDPDFLRRARLLSPSRIRKLLEPWVAPQFIEAVVRRRADLITDLEITLKAQSPEGLVELVDELPRIDRDVEVDGYYSPNARTMKQWFDSLSQSPGGSSSELLFAFVKVTTAALREDKIRGRDYRRLLALPFSSGVEDRRFLRSMVELYDSDPIFRSEIDTKGEFFETVYEKNQRRGMERTREFYKTLMHTIGVVLAK